MAVIFGSFLYVVFQKSLPENWLTARNDRVKTVSIAIESALFP
jgi:hypothetical protein